MGRRGELSLEEGCCWDEELGREISQLGVEMSCNQLAREEKKIRPIHGTTVAVGEVRPWLLLRRACVA